MAESLFDNHIYENIDTRNILKLLKGKIFYFGKK